MIPNRGEAEDCGSSSHMFQVSEHIGPDAKIPFCGAFWNSVVLLKFWKKGKGFHIKSRSKSCQTYKGQVDPGANFSLAQEEEN